MAARFCVTSNEHNLARAKDQGTKRQLACYLHLILVWRSMLSYCELHCGRLHGQEQKATCNWELIRNFVFCQQTRKFIPSPSLGQCVALADSLNAAQWGSQSQLHKLWQVLEEWKVGNDGYPEQPALEGGHTHTQISKYTTNMWSLRIRCGLFLELDSVDNACFGEQFLL